MALAPTPVPAPGAAAPDSMAPAGEMPMEGETEGGGWEVCCTILRNPESGEFKLISGDEPEAEEGADMGAAEGQVFKDGPELLRAVMAEIEGTPAEAADAAFDEGYTGKPAAAKPPMPMA